MSLFRLKTVEKAAVVVTLLLFFAALGTTVNARSQSRSAQVQITTMTPPPPQETAPVEGLVNINTADVDELCSLKGIGPAIAGRIVAYREEHGAFANTADIIDVSGIGFAVFEKIKDSITV